MKERHRALQALSFVVMTFAVTFAGGLFTGELLVQHGREAGDGGMKDSEESKESKESKDAKEGAKLSDVLTESVHSTATGSQLKE